MTLSLADPGQNVASLRRRRRKRQSEAPPLVGLVPLVIGLVVWQAVGNANSPYFPPPGTWLKALHHLLEEGQLLKAITQTVVSFAVAILIAAVVGSVLGVAVGASTALDRMLGPTFELCRALPAPGIVPVAVLILGYTTTMTLSVVVFAACWPILLQTRAGTAGISKERIEVGRVFQLSLPRRIAKILWPSVLPDVFLGVRVAAPLTLVMVLLVEILTQVGGIGTLMARAQSQFASADVYGLVIVAGALGLIMNLGLSLLESLLLRGRPAVIN